MATEILSVNELSSAVATKFPTYNEGLRQREGQITRVLSRAVTAPPVSPALGDAYIIPVGATGDWAGLTDYVVHWYVNGWKYYIPFEGMQVRIVDELPETFAYDGTNWVVGLAAATPAAVSVTSVGGVLTLDMKLKAEGYFYTTLFENITSIVISNWFAFFRVPEVFLEVQSDGASSITWEPVYRWDNNTPPAQSVTLGNVDLYRFRSWSKGINILAHQVVGEA